MSNPDTKGQIRSYLERVIQNAEIKDDDDIFENGFVNSLFAVELVAFTENTFGIEVEDDDLDLANFNSIDALAVSSNGSGRRRKLRP